MMREILFRGKKISDGEWMEGDLLRTSVDGVTYSFIFLDNYTYNQETGEVRANSRALVEPSTVGQYTGTKDKNGKRIFEGDIYKYFDDEIQVVEWSEEFSRTMLHSYGDHEVKCGRKKVKVKHDGWCDLEDYPLEEMEYLGNIHDNPELIGGMPDAL